MKDQEVLFSDPAPHVKADRSFAFGAPQLGAALRDDAIQRVEAHADPDWKDVAGAAVLELARARQEFTTDDVWRAIGGQAETHEPRAMGAVMRRLAHQRVIVNTHRTVESIRPECHRRPVAVWRSRIIGQAS